MFTLFLILWVAVALAAGILAALARRTPDRPTNPTTREAWRKRVREELT